MKYLKLFQTNAEYAAYAEGDMILPNVSYITESSQAHFKPYVPPPISLCDIAYWDGSKVKAVSQDKWNSDLGTPVGVVVIPEGFAPDGKARMISLSGQTTKMWRSSSTGTDTSLTNYEVVPTTDNAGSITTGSNSSGYLPSDNFTGATSFVDSKAKYSQTSNLIPSPYLGNDQTFNSEYSKTILSGDTNVNCLSDFNGLENTEYLQSLGAYYQAAQHCWSYSDGASNLQWYLPAAGELGFLVPRFNAINAAITAVGGVAVESLTFWSSSENSPKYAYCVGTGNGIVGNLGKTNNRDVRPFAVLP